MAGQDFTRTIPAGGAYRLNANGETYIFCKFADRDVTFDIAGKKVVMRAGSYQEFAPLRGENSAVTLYNEDPDNPVKVVFVMGVGTYDEKIIRGEIVVDPRVKTADGQYVSDQRATNNILVSFDWKREPIINQGDYERIVDIDKAEFPDDDEQSHNGFSVDGGLYWTYYSTQSGEYIIGIDPDSNSIVTVTDAPPATSILKTGGLIYAAKGDKYLYSFTYGRTTALDSDDRVSSFAVEGAFISNVFWGPGGDVWAMDADYKFYNMTKGYKAFDPNDGNMRTGAAIGNRVYAFNNQEDWLEYEEDENGTWQQVGSGSSGASWNDLAGAVYMPSFGQFLVCDNRNLSGGQFSVYTVEPKDYGEAEVHYGAAVQHCTRLPGLLNPAQTHMERSDAVVSVVWENGRAYASGEVIKATLDLLGVDTSGDYLDQITGFQARAKYQDYNINLGGRTFAADEIEDDFQDVELPQVLTLTALNALWSNRA